MTITSSGAQSPAGETSFEDRWRLAFVAAVLVCIVYALIPVDSVALDTILYAGVEAAAGVAILIGVRLYRPDAPGAWWALAAALFSWTVADVIWGVYQGAGKDPFPSWADPSTCSATPSSGSRSPLRRGRGPRASICARSSTRRSSPSPWASPPGCFRSTPRSRIPRPTVEQVRCGHVPDLRPAARRRRRTPHLRRAVGRSVARAPGDRTRVDPGRGPPVRVGPEEAAYELVLADTLLLAGTASLGLAGLHPTMTALTAPPVGPTTRTRT